ncbi:MAG: SAM-dependent methyltransferase [Blastocatellia bacterium]
MNDSALNIANAVSSVAETHRNQLLELISSYNNYAQANETLNQLTGIRGFFPCRELFKEFQRQLLLPDSTSLPGKSREWGDFQTPSSLAAQICKYLSETGIQPQIIIEPTYGLGRFILAALKSFPTARLIYGVEIQEKYEWHLKIALLIKSLSGHRASAEIELHRDDIFSHRFPAHILEAQDVLVIGNPPWVTNAELGSLESHNLPTKRNLKSLDGLDAMTGKSNFDIGEFILLRFLEIFSNQRGRLAILCKNSVIKNLVAALPQRLFNVSNIRALEIDAKREFGASVDASLLTLEMGARNPVFSCKVGKLDLPNRIIKSFGWAGEKFVSNIEDYAANSELDGESPFIWRQGMKHDCARIMELSHRDDLWVNGNGEALDVEDEHIYWLMKSSDLRAFEVKEARKKVIVTQQRLGEDTSELERKAPALWQYLTRNEAHFAARKSVIYRGKPRFSIFGIGDYSFKPYKVAISGLYKESYFSIVPPISDRPVMMDDTCYYLGFDNYFDALFSASLLNNRVVKCFLQSIVFSDAKRPYTKEALMRIDLAKAASRVSFRMIVDEWKSLNFKPIMTVAESDYETYRLNLSAARKNQYHTQLSFA